ncbi:MAG TPA: hypothetical protein VN932_01880 [Rhizomicrobium sp.]|nr:hypothetical protein [Rhizomicrobium sp.]
MQSWTDFYEMTGGAAATLLGLLFVSVSVNAQAILGATHQHPRRMAEQGFQNYLAVLMISLLVLFPHMDNRSLGISILCVVGIWAAWVLARMYSTLMGPRATESRFAAARRFLSSVIGYSILIYSAARMALGQGDYHQLLAVSLILLLFSATAVSWELLTSIAREKSAAPKDPP